MQRTKAAIPRRPCRQPAAPRAAQGGAREAREGRDHRRAAQGGRGPRDREDHQEAGGDRAASSRPTASSAAPGGSSISTRGSTASSSTRPARASQFAGVETKAESVRVVGKVGFLRPSAPRAFPLPQGPHQGDAEDDHPGALDACISARAGNRSASRSIPTSKAISTMSAQAYRKAIRAFYDAGCRYLQLDDTAWSMICDPKERAAIARSAATIPTACPRHYARMTNQALAGRPADMVVTMHSCRGNFRSTFIAQGGYEPCGGTAARRGRHRRLFPGIRHRSRRRLRAAALRAQGQEAGRARPGHLEERHAGEEGRHQAAHRRGDEISSTSISSACRRNAALPRPRKAISWPRTSNGRSFAMIVELADEVWGDRSLITANSDCRPAGSPRRYSPILCKGSPRNPGQANQATTWRKACLHD